MNVKISAGEPKETETEYTLIIEDAALDKMTVVIDHEKYGKFTMNLGTMLAKTIEAAIERAHAKEAANVTKTAEEPESESKETENDTDTE